MPRIVLRLRCPYHDDDRPSLMVYEDLHTHCFGCGYHRPLRELLIDLLGPKQALEALWTGTWKYFLRVYCGASSVGRPFDPGRKIPWNPDHPALRGVRVSRETLESRGCYLTERSLALHFSFLTPDGLVEGQQYRLGPGQYVFPLGFPASKGLAYFPASGPASGPVVLTEGVLDSLRLLELGWRGRAVALLGSYLSEPRLEVLRGMEGPVLAMLDRDPAGERILSEISQYIPVIPVEYDADDPQEVDRLPDTLLEVMDGGR